MSATNRFPSPERRGTKTDVQTIARLERVDKAGWSTGMVLVPLSDGGLAVYSPTWVGPETVAAVRAHGEPRVLIAPNGFHHLSLPRFREAFPDAVAVASDATRERLRRKGHPELAPLSEAPLGEGVRFLELPHTKTGETWLEIERPEGTSWVVGDAFFNVERPLRGLLGAFLRATRTGPGLSLGQTFRWLALGDERAYRRWFLARLDAAAPRAIHFCHGDTAEGTDLPDRLRALAEARLRV